MSEPFISPVKEYVMNSKEHKCQWIQYILGGLIIIFCSPVLANNIVTCGGEWSVSVSNNPVDTSLRDRGDFWFPASIELSKSLAMCVKTVEIESMGRGVDRIVRGPQGGVASSLSDEKRVPLIQNGKGSYVLQTLGKRRINFWLYISKGKHLSPGMYNSELRFAINPNTEHNSERYASFQYTAKPYVKARLNGQGQNGLSYTGSSIRLDIGNLTKKNHHTLDFIVQSNTSVKVWLTSENKGQLVNMDAPHRTIPYFIIIGGRRNTLASPIEYNLYNTSNLKGVPLKIGVENEASPYATAGIYQDVMTMSLFAQ